MAVVRIGALLLGIGVVQAFLPRIWTPLGNVDLLLIFVVYHSLTMRFRNAVLTAAAAGLVQDSLAGAILGLYAFSKTSVAAAVASVGNVLVIRGDLPILGILFLAEIAESALVVLLLANLGRGGSMVFTGSLLRATLTAAAAVIGTLVVRRFRRWRRGRRA